MGYFEVSLDAAYCSHCDSHVGMTEASVLLVRSLEASEAQPIKSLVPADVMRLSVMNSTTFKMPHSTSTSSRERRLQPRCRLSISYLLYKHGALGLIGSVALTCHFGGQRRQLPHGCISSLTIRLIFLIAWKESSSPSSKPLLPSKLVEAEVAPRVVGQVVSGKLFSETTGASVDSQSISSVLPVSS